MFQIGVIFKAATDGYASDKIRQELVFEEDFSVNDNFSRTGLRVFQIGVIFKAAMDGYASDKIRQELVSEEDCLVSDNFPRTG